MAFLGRVFPVTLAAACVVALIAGCGAGDDSARNAEGGRDTLVSEEIPEVEIPARWASANANDIETLIASTGTVLVGEVTAIEGQRNAEIGPGAGESPDAANNDAGRHASIPISRYNVTVARSLVGGLSEGQSVVLEQPGGLITRTDGSQACIVLEGDEPLAVGTRYLMFASVRADGVLTSAPFGRFVVVGDGSLTPLSEWSGLPVARQLAGQKLEEAAAEVSSVAR